MLVVWWLLIFDYRGFTDHVGDNRRALLPIGISHHLSFFTTLLFMRTSHTYCVLSLIVSTHFLIVLSSFLLSMYSPVLSFRSVYHDLIFHYKWAATICRDLQPSGTTITTAWVMDGPLVRLNKTMIQISQIAFLLFTLLWSSSPSPPSNLPNQTFKSQRSPAKHPHMFFTSLACPSEWLEKKLWDNTA